MDTEINSSISFDGKNLDEKLYLSNIKLQNNIDYIIKSLNNIDDLIDESHEYFSGEFSNSFYEKYAQYRVFFKLIVENLDAYKSELLDSMINASKSAKTEVKTDNDWWIR